MAKAFQVLEHDAASIDLIICTIAFDESRMIERVLPSVLSDDSVGRVGTVCKNCGAVDLLDLGKLDDGAARTALRAAVMLHGAPRPAKL